MSLDIYILKKPKRALCKECEDFKENIENFNITHNLTDMAKVVDLYQPLWRAEELGIETCSDMLKYLTPEKLDEIIAKEEELSKFNPSNGWGSYDVFLFFFLELRTGCLEYPDNKLYFSR